MKAIERFRDLEQGVLEIIKAADVYAIHVMAKIKNTPPALDSIDVILNGNKMSGWNVIGGLYSLEDISVLEEEGHFKQIGQQIIVATHTAFESYLVLKFREYYRHVFSGSSKSAVEASLKKFHPRCLGDFKENYKNVFGIHLPSFEFEFTIEERCNFHPASCWDAINILDSSRHDIVHKGNVVNHKITTLMDSWYPFDVVRQWVYTFDACFDAYIYRGIESALYREHKQRASEAGISI